MPTSKSSLINFSQFSKNKIESLFEKSLQLKTLTNAQNFSPSTALNPSEPLVQVGRGQTAALLFFEPSTRTRFSFEAACARAGYHPMVLDGGIGTSLEKGETVTDTILNIEAMRPLFFVIRCNNDLNLQEVAKGLSVPVINAGWGLQGHPTQALLDTLSLFEKWQSLTKKKILFVGDVKHSRVVASHFELSQILNYEIGICAPTEFLPTSEKHENFKYFEKLEDALEWADAVMALRVQKERHDGSFFDVVNYRKKFGLNSERLSKVSPKTLIMHPGPINYGVELEKEVLNDPRSLVLQQVENGVFLREALIRNLFKETL
ncbi:MAG: aspartate carbamoyltransferase catalytic subunit [Bdellovibrio sp.]|nr:aspartate carbamoyltransferase catalytic subunit [Bdellovibrio sp.]